MQSRYLTSDSRTRWKEGNHQRNDWDSCPPVLHVLVSSGATSTDLLCVQRSQQETVWRVKTTELLTGRTWHRSTQRRRWELQKDTKQDETSNSYDLGSGYVQLVVLLYASYFISMVFLHLSYFCTTVVVFFYSWHFNAHDWVLVVAFSSSYFYSHGIFSTILMHAQ